MIIISLMLWIIDIDKDVLVNKEIINDNIEINYPYFNDNKIDNFINEYLDRYKDKNGIIDYDYDNNDNKYYVVFYKYFFDSNIYSYDLDSFMIDLDSSTISMVYTEVFNYDIITNKKINSSDKLIALTFDDGPNYNTGKVLDVLAKYNVKATFFVLGSKAKDNKKILKRENPDLVITYSIKPNIYAGYLCGKMKIPFLANVQGLGTAFQKPVLSDMVTVMYRTALRKVEKVIFENQANAQEFKKRRILSEEKEVVLHGAGINLKEYRYRFYPNNEKIHFLYLGRIMKEKGMDELFGAIERLRKDGCEFVLDLVGFFEEEYRKKVEHLQKEGIKSRRLCNDVPVCVC
mgnify:CR=1 FL=1